MFKLVPTRTTFTYYPATLIHVDQRCFTIIILHSIHHLVLCGRHGHPLLFPYYRISYHRKKKLKQVVVRIYSSSIIKDIYIFNLLYLFYCVIIFLIYIFFNINYISNVCILIYHIYINIV